MSIPIYTTHVLECTEYAEALDESVVVNIYLNNHQKWYRPCIYIDQQTGSNAVLICGVPNSSYEVPSESLGYYHGTGKKYGTREYWMSTPSIQRDNTNNIYYCNVYTIQSKDIPSIKTVGTPKPPKFASREACYKYIATGDDSGRIDKFGSGFDWTLEMKRIKQSSSGWGEKIINTQYKVFCTPREDTVVDWESLPDYHILFSTIKNYDWDTAEKDSAVFRQGEGLGTVYDYKELKKDSSTNAIIISMYATEPGGDGASDAMSTILVPPNGNTLDTYIHHGGPADIFGQRVDESTLTIKVVDEFSDTPGPYPPVDAVNSLMTIYRVTSEQLSELGQFIWSDDFIKNAKMLKENPIENIISLVSFPTSISDTHETSTTIGIGGVLTGIPGYNCPNASIGFPLGQTFTVSPYYGSFLDYAPYTTLTIYLPYIGYRELDINKYMNRTVSVWYYFDLLTGTCKALLWDFTGPNQELLDFFDGVAGQLIPITASNNSDIANSFFKAIGSSIVSAAAGAATGALSGSVIPGLGTAAGAAVGAGIGLATGVGNAAVQAASTPTHYTRAGSVNGCLAGIQDSRIILFYERPNASYAANYNHTYGRPCNKTYQLKQLSGYTEAIVHTDNLAATSTEKDTITTLISQGIYM